MAEQGYPSDAKAAPAAPAAEMPAEKTKEELAKMSKEERTAYHAARRAAAPASAKAKPAQLTKEQRRALQESQRKVKEDKANVGKEGDEMFEELKLQGLTPDQAREVMAAMKDGGTLEENNDDEDGEEEDLLASVKRWMGEQPEVVPEDAIRDFNMKVRFQGHVDTTPPDHLGALLKVLVEQACSTCNIKDAGVKTSQMSTALAPLLERWTPMLTALYKKTAELDVIEAVGVLMTTIQETVAASGAAEDARSPALVGCLMAIREFEDLVEDEDLLVGLKSIESRSTVLDKYTEFIEDAIAEDDDEEDDDEEEK